MQSLLLIQCNLFDFLNEIFLLLQCKHFYVAAWLNSEARVEHFTI